MRATASGKLDPRDRSRTGGRTGRHGPRGRDVLVALLLIALTCAAYARVGGFEFLRWDDRDYVVENEAVTGGLSLENARWAFTAFHSSNWHPLTWLSHMLDVELFGLDAGAHHRTNVGLHALNAVLCFAFLRLATGAFWSSALVAALFALHPLRVQAVAWVSERKELLAGAFFFLTLIAYTRYARRPSRGRYGLALAAFALGLLAKPMLVTLPAVLLIADVWPLGRVRRTRSAAPGDPHPEPSPTSPDTPPARLLLEKLPFLLLAALSSVATVLAQRSGDTFSSLADLSLGARISNAVGAVATYVERTLWPHDLAYFYPHPALVDPAWTPLNARLFLGGALIVAVTAAAFVLARRGRPELACGWSWFLVMLLPVIGLVQVGEQAWADRYAYLSTVGLLIAVVWTGRALVAGRPRVARWLVGAVTAGLVLAAGAATRAEAEHWRDSESLYRRALAVTERNYEAHLALGNVYLDAGAYAPAEAEYRAALAVRPEHPFVLYNYGLLFQNTERLPEALELFDRAAESEPTLASAHFQAGVVAARLGQNERARASLEEARGLAPQIAEIHFNLAGLDLLEGRLESAAANLAEALAHYERDGDSLEAHHLRGRVCEELGRRAEALAHYERAGALAEPTPELLRRRAWLLATSPEAELRDGARAVRLAEQAVAATGEADVDALEALAAALAEVGEFDAAARWQEQAASRAPLARRADARRRKALYEAGSPFRLSSE